MRKIIGIAILLLIFLISCSTEDTQFYFIQITDTHIGDGDYLARTEKVVDAINNLPFNISCVVHTGDIYYNVTSKEIFNKGLNEFEKLNYPVHFVPGNHDKLLNNFVEVYDNYIPEGVHYYKEYNGVFFIFLYSEQILTEEPLEWLESVLRTCGNSPVIIFHHTPCVDDFYNNKMHDGWPEYIKDKWINVLNRYNVKAVIAGHFHRDEQHWLGRVPLYICPPVATYYGRQTAFRIYEYSNGLLSYRTQYVAE